MGLRAVKIDTLGLAKELENAGIPRPQAEAQIQTTIKVIDMAIEEKLATKHDLTHGLHQLEEKLSTEIIAVKNDVHKLDKKLTDLQHDFDSKFSRLENKFDSELNGLESKFDSKFNSLENKFDSELNGLESKFDSKFNSLENKFDSKFMALENKLDRLSQNLLIQLGGLVFAGILALAAIIKL